MTQMDPRLALARRARQQLQGTSDSGAVLESLRTNTTRAATLESTGGGQVMLLGVDSGGLAPSLDAAPAVAAHDVWKAANEAMDKVEAEGTASNLTDFQVVSLEAIVQLTGRPAMRYTDNVVQPPPNENGDNERWLSFVKTARSKINRASSSVGQVGRPRPDGGVDPIGTAWRLSSDLVVTNRHVAAFFVTSTLVSPSQWTFDPNKPAIVNFSVTDKALSTKRFNVTELLYCAPEQTVDLAIFRIDAAGEELPKPLPLDFDADSVGREVQIGAAKHFQGEEIYVVGHPFREATTSAVATVFGVADGFKRCSPGLVTTISQFEHAFEHDCSTLGGNSGSCVLSVATHKVIGLHYGGVAVDANQMGLANVALGLARLGDHPAAAILRTGKKS